MKFKTIFYPMNIIIQPIIRAYHYFVDKESIDNNLPVFEQFEEFRIRKNVILMTFLCFPLSLLMFFSRFYSEGNASKSVWLIFMVSIFIFVTPFLCKKYKKYEEFVLALFFIASFVTFIRIYNTGGFKSSIIVWLFAYLPLCLNLLRKKSLFILLFTYLCFIVFLGFHQALGISIPLHDSSLNLRFAVTAIALITAIAGTTVFISDQKTINFKLIDTERNLASGEKLMALGQVSAGVSHEISNPLAILKISNGSILRNANKLQAIGPEKDKIKKNALKAEKSIERIEEIIKNLRFFNHEDFLSIASNVSVQQTLVYAQEFYKIINGQDSVGKELIINNNYDEILFKGNRTLIEQVISNLINNAVYEMKESQQENKFVRIDVEKNANEILTIRLTDGGLGIPAHIEKEIFNTFYTTKPAGVGSGIGLDLCKNIIEKHKGKIYINHQHKNTQFVIELPLSKKAA